MASETADMARCPACNRVVAWRVSLTGTRYPIDGEVLIRLGTSGKEQVMNRYGVLVHTAKVVKEDGELAWLLHTCAITGKLSKFREIGGGRGGG